MLVGANNDERIQKLLKRHGIELKLPKRVLTQVKKPVFDENGPLALIRLRRNDLAHGLISFAECGRGLTVPDLRRWTFIVVVYLRAVIEHFEHYLDKSQFRRNTA
jgi:hypothetical protein